MTAREAGRASQAGARRSLLLAALRQAEQGRSRGVRATPRGEDARRLREATERVTRRRTQDRGAALDDVTKIADGERRRRS